MIFAKNKDFCQEFLRVILEDDKLEVIENDIQKVIPSAFNKNVVLDMLCKLKTGEIVNVEIQLKEDIFNKGRTVYEVRMDIVSDQNEIVEKWNAGLEVYYVNTKGLTNKTINEYLKLLTDKTTLNNNYQITSKIKENLYTTKEGIAMSKELQAVFDEVRKEERKQGMQQGKISTFVELVKNNLLSIKVAAESLNMTENEFTELIK